MIYKSNNKSFVLMNFGVTLCFMNMSEDSSDHQDDMPFFRIGDSETKPFLATLASWERAPTPNVSILGKSSRPNRQQRSPRMVVNSLGISQNALRSWFRIEFF